MISRTEEIDQPRQKGRAFAIVYAKGSESILNERVLIEGNEICELANRTVQIFVRDLDRIGGFRTSLRMEDTTRLTDPEDDRRRENQKGDGKRRVSPTVGPGSSKQEFGDDECSTDSGCSSGGSTGSAERLSRRGSSERLCRATRSPRTHCYLDRLRGRPTRSQERLSSIQRSSERVRAKSSRSWSPGDVRGVGRTSESLSYSSSPSDAHSSTDSDSLKRSSTADTLRRALQTLKISSKWEGKENKHAKKSPKRILRSPVSYTYVRGLSGLPTQRVPRNMTQQLTMPCSCQDTVGLYR